MEKRNSVPHEALEQHRRDIEALDRRILHLVCERLELARQIGNLKQECGVPLRNFEVEAQVHQRFEKASEDLGLHSTLGKDLALFLIDKAVEEQATLMDSAYHGDQLRALVVGGKGGMGSWIAKFLGSQGHRVTVFDPAENATPFPEDRSLREGVGDVDLIIVAVPMGDTAEVLEEIAALKPHAVVAEMCSLKGHLQPVISRLRRDGLRIVSFHPMFGPDVRMLSGRKVVFCCDAAAQDLDMLTGLFKHTSADLVVMDVKEHDRRMALVLGLTHFNNLAYARALSHSKVSANDLAQVAGVTFQKQLVTTHEVTQENPDLYFQIQSLNAVTSETAQWLLTAVEEIRDVVATDDVRAFTALMGECRDFLGDSAGVAP